MLELENDIMPLMSYVMARVQERKIAGVEYVNRYIEATVKRAIVYSRSLEGTEDTSSAEQRILRYLDEKSNPAKRNRNSAPLPTNTNRAQATFPMSRPLRSRNKGEAEVPATPLPYGEVYTAEEIVEYLLPMSHAQRARKIEDMIKTKLVFIDKSAIYERLKQEDSYTPLLSEAEVGEAVHHLLGNDPEKSLSLEDVGSFIRGLQKKRASEPGQVPLFVNEPSITSLVDYRALIIATANGTCCCYGSQCRAGCLVHH